MSEPEEQEFYVYRSREPAILIYRLRFRPFVENPEHHNLSEVIQYERYNLVPLIAEVHLPIQFLVSAIVDARGGIELPIQFHN